MKEVISVSNMRRSDEYTIKSGTPSRELMYRAALGIYNSIPFEKFSFPDILIVCGTGNNAGDGYALALILKENGYRVRLLLVEERFSADGEYYFNKCKSEGIDYSVYERDTDFRADIIVDCVFGTGFKGAAKDPYKDVIEKINISKAYVISADINSGLNGDCGLGESVVKSDLTVSIGSYKSGHFLNMAKDKIGELTNVDIGISPVEAPFYLYENEDAKGALPKRENFSHKGTYGYIALIGGSYEYSGAIKLAGIASSAVRSGAGVVKIATPKRIADAVLPYVLESTLFPLSDRNGRIKFKKNEIEKCLNGVKAVGIGMGLNQGKDNEKLIKFVLENYSLPVLLDADALNTLSNMDEGILKSTKCKIVLTPHLKEFERLSKKSINEIQINPVECARDYARKNGVTLLLKGTSTIVTDGENVRIITSGCGGMATAGSGDVLSGIITSFLGQNPDNVYEMVCLGAFVNGKAGEIAQKKMGEISMSSHDTALSVAEAIKSI